MMFVLLLSYHSRVTNGQFFCECTVCSIRESNKDFYETCLHELTVLKFLHYIQTIFINLFDYIFIITNQMSINHFIKSS